MRGRVVCQVAREVFLGTQPYRLPKRLTIKITAFSQRMPGTLFRNAKGGLS